MTARISNLDWYRNPGRLTFAQVVIVSRINFAERRFLASSAEPWRSLDQTAQHLLPSMANVYRKGEGSREGQEQARRTGVWLQTRYNDSNRELSEAKGTLNSYRYNERDAP